jgi:hypothetical protein
MGEAAPFDKLPDELIVKIFGYLMKQKEDMSSLRQTCKRFCRIINGNLVTQPDSVEYGWDWGEFCAQCVKIFAVSNLKFAKCNTLFMDVPLEGCCFNTLKTLKSKLNTITGLVLCGSIGLNTLCSLLATLETVHRLQLSYWSEGAVGSTQIARLLDRTLSYLEIDGFFSTELSGLLNFPSRDIRVRYLTNRNVSWVKRYLSRHQRILNHAEVTTDARNSSACIAELSETMESLGFNVKTRLDFVGNIALEGFKTTSSSATNCVPYRRSMSTHTESPSKYIPLSQAQ